MKYSIIYGRKVQIVQYEPVEIHLSKEFDETTPLDEAFEIVRMTVNKWLKDEVDRLRGAK